jgi:hypothetical protein
MAKICKKKILVNSDETTFHLSGQQYEVLVFKSRGLLALILVEQTSETVVVATPSISIWRNGLLSLRNCISIFAS